MKLLYVFLLPLFIFAKDITVGVIAISGLQQSVKEWTPTIEHLQNALPQYHFQLIAIEPHDMDRLKELITKEKIDFVITQPAIYIELELELGVSRILTMIKQGGLSEFGSVLITRKSTTIKSLLDIKGKTISAVAALGFGGWLVAYNELIQKGIDPLADNKVTFEGTQTKVVKAILEAKSEVGVIRTGILEKLKDKGAVDVDRLRVINPQTDQNFPYLLSTKLYPEWALAKSKSTSHSIAKEVALAFLSITESSKAAQSAFYDSWTFPYNYQPVHDLMKDLKVGAYKDYGKMTASEIFYEYNYLFLTFILLFVFLVGFIFYSRFMNEKLYTQQVEKNKLFDQLETIFNLQMGLLLVMEKGEIVRANKAFLQFFDLPNLTDFLKYYGVLENAFEYVDNDDYITTEKYKKHWLDFLLDNASVNRHYKVKMKETVFSIDVKRLPLDKDIQVVMLSDITHLENNKAFLESQIQMAKKEIIEKQKILFAQSKLASMGEMIGVIAHQLKQPLSTISSFNNNILISLMFDDFKKEDIAEILNKETQSIELMSNTIDEFRTFFSPNKVAKVFLLDHCISSVLTLMAPLLQNNHIRISYKADPTIRINSLENELFHVIMNIINNAKDALVEMNVENPLIDIKAYDNGETVTVVIEDNGGGIDDAIMGKIFNQYFTTKDSSGTGIGLYLSKLIVEDSLGGSLEVCNGSDGAQFTIKL